MFNDFKIERHLNDLATITPSIKAKAIKRYGIFIAENSFINNLKSIFKIIYKKTIKPINFNNPE